jgi:hypothetical protein
MDERHHDRERKESRASLHLQIELADQRAPAAVLALDVGAVFLRRRRQRIAAVGAMRARTSGVSMPARSAD